MKRILRGLVSLGLFVGLVPVVATAADAAAGDCSSGYMCLWTENDWYGSVYGTAANTRSLHGMSADNQANGVSANGASCYYSYYWDPYSASGSHFTMYSKQLMGYNYRDPDLHNGAGHDGTGINWENRVSYLSFGGC